jgi:hypothetical protein
MKDLRLPLLLAILSLGLAGCSWFSDELTVSAVLPELPGHWQRAFPELRYEFLAPGVAECGPWPEGGRLRIPKQPNWPVLAVPHVRDGRLHLRPAGAVWPLDLTADGQALAFSWERGPLAETLLALRREQVEVSTLNTTRLASEMQTRSEGDPWRLDLVHLEERLASGDFRETDIRALPARDILLAVPAGQWFLETPFRLPQSIAEDQALALPGVPYGAHRLFSSDGRSSYSLYVGQQDILVELNYSPISCTRTVRSRGRLSWSMSVICCQVPSSTAPSATGRVRPGPMRVALR